MVQIKITALARKDIRGIHKYILQDSYQNAELVAESIIRKIVKEFNNPVIRELKLFKYRIIYRLKTPEHVEIITIQHSSRLLNNNPHLKDLFE